MMFGACRTGAKSSANSFKAPAGDSTAIIAGLDTIGITKGQVEKLLQPMVLQIAQQAQATGQSFDAVAVPLRRQATAQLLIQELMKAEAAKLKIVADPARVDSIFNSIMKQYPDTAKFMAAMAQAGDDEASLKLKLASQVSANAVIEQALADSLKIPDARIDSFYKANQDKLGEAGKVRGRHILKLVKDPKDSAAVHKAILDISAKLAKGGDFAAIAKVESDDPGSKGNGGDLGWFDPKDMVPEFATAANTLELGKISAPVRSQFGWHIIQIQDRKSGKAPALDSVKPMIVNMLKSQVAERVIPAWYRRTFKAHNLKFLDTLYREPSLFEEPKPALAPAAAPAGAKK
jgi:parvulin-like peptidyl-prolyl isomerase